MFTYYMKVGVYNLCTYTISLQTGSSDYSESECDTCLLI